MAKNKKNSGFITVIIAVAVLVVIIVVYKKFIKKDTLEAVEASSVPGGSSLPAPKPGTRSVGNNGTLKKGVKAKEVQWLQYYYNTNIATPQGKTKLAEDSIFGSKTEAAVKSVTGGTSTTWTAFKAKVDSLKTNNTNQTDIATATALNAAGLGWMNLLT